MGTNPKKSAAVLVNVSLGWGASSYYSDARVRLRPDHALRARRRREVQ
jgi:hypothetical protein